MLFRKRQRKGLFSEVDNSSHIVHDFRRRSNKLFENYRAVGYKKPDDCDLETLKAEDAMVLDRLYGAHAFDAGNEDCLVDMILGPVREGIRSLEKQSFEHMDFYQRQKKNMHAHVADIERIIEMWKEKEAVMLKEHIYTQMLWDRYSGHEHVEKEEVAYES